MALILNIETSTNVCSVCLADDKNIIASRETGDGQSHASLLAVFIDEVFKETGLGPKGLDAVAVSKGPGSYTGLRIGVSTAKGICYGLDIPLIAINTLKSIAYGYEKTNKVNKKTLLCPMIDARRMEVYSAVYDVKNTCIREVQANIIDENSFQEYLTSQQVFFMGNGAEKCKLAITSDNAVFFEDFQCSSNHMVDLSLQAFKNKNFVDTAYFEPFYLKNFITTVPKKNIFK